MHRLSHFGLIRQSLSLCLNVTWWVSVPFGRASGAASRACEKGALLKFRPPPSADVPVQIFRSLMAHNAKGLPSQSIQVCLTNFCITRRCTGCLLTPLTMAGFGRGSLVFMCWQLPHCVCCDQAQALLCFAESLTRSLQRYRAGLTTQPQARQSTPGSDCTVVVSAE